MVRLLGRALIYVVLFGVCGLTINLVYEKLNLFQIDTAGQLASSFFFTGIGFHQYNIHWFMGYVNNLFYPPAQDIIAAFITWIGGYHPIEGFRFYLICLILFYFFSIFRLQKGLKAIISKALYIALFIGYFLIDKQILTYFQGGGLIDIYFTGLNSQILGLSFLNLLVAELLTKNRSLIVLLLGICGFLSHIIVIPFIVLLVFFRRLSDKTRENLIVWCGILFSTSFFWFPFLYSRFLLTSANVIFPVPLLLTGGLLLAIILSYLFGRKILTYILLTGLLLLIPSELYSWFLRMGISLDLPAFHYYRFASPALGILLIGSVHLFDEFFMRRQILPYKKRQSIIILIIVLSFLFVFLKEFKLTSWSRLSARVAPYDIEKFDLQALNTIDDNKRIFVIDHKRAIDFNLDSLLLTYYPNLLFVKGLYRESHFSNQILTSYLSNLLSSQDMIVDYFNVGELSCGKRSLLWNRFIQRYAIGWLLVDNVSESNWLDDEKKECLKQTLSQGTSEFYFKQTGKILLNNLTYSLIKVIPLTGSLLDNSLVQIVHPREIKVIDNGSDGFAFRQLLIDDMSDNTGSYLYPTTKTSAYSGFDLDGYIDSTGYIAQLEQSGGLISRNVIGNSTTLTHIKLNWYPGLEIVDSMGNKLLFVPVIDGIIVRGSGEMKLVFGQISLYIFVYRFSLVFVIVSCFLLRFFNKKAQTIVK